MRRPHWSAWVLGAALGLLLGAGCGKRGPTGVTLLSVPDARDEGGWPLYEVKAEGFALSLPPDWRQFDMDPATFEAQFRKIAERSPELGQLLGPLRQQVAAGVKFYGVDAATVGTGFGTNVNVLRLPLPPGQTLDAVAADAVAQYDALPNVAGPVARDRVSGPEGGRERLRVRLSVTNPAGKTDTLAFTQYIAARGGEVYTVTLTTLASQESKYAQTFDRIGRSFRFTK